MSFRKGNGGFQRTRRFLKRHCLSDVITFWEPPTGNSVESSQCKTWPVQASRKLDILESRHRLCDMCYAFAVRFGHLDAVEPVLEYKAGLSEAIREELSSHGLTPRRCRNCGKVLPWNYPYGLCQDCYGQRSWNWERYW